MCAREYITYMHENSRLDSAPMPAGSTNICSNTQPTSTWLQPHSHTTSTVYVIPSILASNIKLSVSQMETDLR